ncbi:MAG: response regulator [Lentisphaerae bacterium]|nr:MAG: response regulator [Lentisphaerota bacterium]
MSDPGPQNRIGRILIVEDNPLVACMERSALHERGFWCDLTVSLREAIHLLRELQYHLVVLDHDVSDGKGVYLLDWLTQQGIEVPVLYVSSVPPSVSGTAAQGRRTVRILRKPLDINKLCNEAMEMIPKQSLMSFPSEVTASERAELFRLLAESLINDRCYSKIEKAHEQ